MASLGTKAIFKQDLQTVWDVIATVENYSSWRSDIKNLEIIDENYYVESTMDGYETTFRVMKKEPFSRIELRMDNVNLEGRWSIQLNRTSEGTEFLLNQTANAYKLYMQPFVRNYLKAQQMMYMENLKSRLEQL